MHNLCIPGPVVVLVRRLVHVISTISVAQQYRVIQSNKIEHVSSPLDREHPGAFTRASTSNIGEEATGFIDSLMMRWTRFSQAGVWNVWWPLLRHDRYAVDVSLSWLGSRQHLSCNSAPALESTLLPPDHNEQRDPERKRPVPTGQGPENRPETHQHIQNDLLHRLMNNPTLYDPVRTPRFPIVLCHGLYGFDVRGPSSLPFLQQHYWSNILSILRKKVGAEVIVTSVPSTGSIASRATKLHNFLQDRAQGRGINFIGHSMGGLDCRHLISRIRPIDYTPLSLTTVGTPHRGSPFMDWCKDNIGLGKLEAKHASDEQSTNDVLNNSSHGSVMSFADSSPKMPKPSLSYNSLPSSFTTLLLSMLDSPAYANLTTKYLNDVFNPTTPDVPGVKYFSVAGRIDGVSIWHPLWLPKMVLDGVESREKEASNRVSFPIDKRESGNDCLVSIQSAKWGEFLGVLEGCDHWDMRGARGLDLGVDFSSVYMSSFARPSAKGGEQDGDRWSLKDWRRFVRLWKSEEDKAVASASMGSSHLHVSSDAAKIRDGDRETALKSSTEKFSAVFDWIVEQVPSVSRKDSSDVFKERSAKRDLATRDGLERLYVALSRKLYDEGL